MPVLRKGAGITSIPASAECSHVHNPKVSEKGFLHPRPPLYSGAGLSGQ